jgi:HlyD family secretion protein
VTQRRWVVGVTAVALIALLAFIFTARRSSPIEVQAEPVVRRPVFRSYVTASGEIVATRYANIGSSAMGRIVSLAVKEGERVAAGQLLARIDPVQASSAADAARAEVMALRAEVEAAGEQRQAATAEVAFARAVSADRQRVLSRLSDLNAEGLVPLADLDAARAGAETAEAQLAAAEAALRRAQQAREAAAGRLARSRADAERARDTLAKTEVASPIDGIVTRLSVQEGEMVVVGIQNQPGTILMTVSDLSAINAEVKVAEAEVLRLSLGSPADVTLEALPGSAFAGQVVEIGASALPALGTGAAVREFRVVIRLQEPAPGLRPGLTCDADILVGERTNALTVPLQAVVPREIDGRERTGVFVVNNGLARFVPVETGLIGGLEIEIDGLDEGTPIVVGPFQTLRELQSGDRVRVSSER